MKCIARSPAKHKCSWLQRKGFQYIQHLCVFKPQTWKFLNKTGYLFETLALKSFSASTFDKFIITVHLNVSLTIFLYTIQFWKLENSHWNLQYYWSLWSYVHHSIFTMKHSTLQGKKRGTRDLVSKKKKGSGCEFMI